MSHGWTAVDTKRQRIAPKQISAQLWQTPHSRPIVIGTPTQERMWHRAAVRQSRSTWGPPGISATRGSKGRQRGYSQGTRLCAMNARGKQRREDTRRTAARAGKVGECQRPRRPAIGDRLAWGCTSVLYLPWEALERSPRYLSVLGHVSYAVRTPYHGCVYHAYG